MISKEKVVSRIFISWNQLDGWLRQIEGLRAAARARVTATAFCRNLDRRSSHGSA
jgi:hypothetical protein